MSVNDLSGDSPTELQSAWLGRRHATAYKQKRKGLIGESVLIFYEDLSELIRTH